MDGSWVKEFYSDDNIIRVNGELLPPEIMEEAMTSFDEKFPYWEIKKELEEAYESKEEIQKRLDEIYSEAFEEYLKEAKANEAIYNITGHPHIEDIYEKNVIRAERKGKDVLILLKTTEDEKKETGCNYRIDYWEARGNWLTDPYITIVFDDFRYVEGKKSVKKLLPLFHHFSF